MRTRTKSPQISIVTNLRIIAFLVLSLIVLSCSTDEAVNIEPSSSDMSIVEVLKNFNSVDVTSSNAIVNKNSNKGNKPTFRTLSVALARTGLAGTVSSNMLTVFAPSDAAFAKYDLDQTNIASVPNLEAILLYHVLAGKIYSNQLANGFFPTLNEAAIEVNLDQGVMVNSANVDVNFVDIKARNGVIHVIDDILFPPTSNLVALAIESFGMESSIVKAVIKADLTSTLAEGGPFTVFVPTEQAFTDLIMELNDPAINSVDDLPADLLGAVLMYHVVEGRVFSSDLSSGAIETLNGTFDLNLGTLTITDANGRESMLVANGLNIQATNGVVHLIDKVLLP
ncbi:fasciclin domain-containing protein [Snuella sedimenti]|uniref:Fasciclin domain-containing protein n=1 Tax=Snuella sedimenti TaxID=2798802 RepID=A0A8J7IG89_9FLAO|nr:fasciclin domain-containing protein [Snuella sedimenti]MBJ6368867.1 fasciclin domain-containing protein [Snuella sedimenti]